MTRRDFSTTPPLSSYITAVVAGPWAVIEGPTWSGGASDGGHVELPLRLACRRTLARYLDSEDVFEVTCAGLGFFHERYGITFPWGSYDQIYVPEYNLGAMENPGCITFNESYISRSTPTFSDVSVARTRPCTRCATCGSVTWQPQHGGTTCGSRSLSQRTRGPAQSRQRPSTRGSGRTSR